MATRRLVAPRPVGADGSPRPAMDDRGEIRALQDLAGASPITSSRDRVASPRTDRRQFRLGDGRHFLADAGASTRLDLHGAGAAGTAIASDLVVSAPVAYFSACRFLGAIAVPATSVVFFTGCELTKEISVANGGRVHLNGCHLSGTAAVVNAGANVNCYITNCHKTSATAHVNVTIISQTT